MFHNWIQDAVSLYLNLLTFNINQLIGFFFNVLDILFLFSDFIGFLNITVSFIIFKLFFYNFFSNRQQLFSLITFTDHFRRKGYSLMAKHWSSKPQLWVRFLLPLFLKKISIELFKKGRAKTEVFSKSKIVKYNRVVFSERRKVAYARYVYLRATYSKKLREQVNTRWVDTHRSHENFRKPFPEISTNLSTHGVK